MAEDITATELINQGNNLKALQKYSVDRGLSFETNGDLLENFLGDYRGVQTNTVGAASFISYANKLEEDSEYKKDLGQLYKTVDDNLESQIFGSGEDIDIGTRAKGVWDYTKNIVVDPINLLGLGAGKAVGLAVAKPIISKLVSSSLGTALAKRPLLAATTGAMIPEAVAAPTMEVLTQKAEKEIGAREEIDTGDVLLATGIGLGTAGLFGFVGEKTFQAIRKRRGDKAVEKIIERLENTTQGRAANQDNIASIDMGEKSGLYVTVNKSLSNKVDDYETFDPMGRIIATDPENEGSVLIEFITKDTRKSVDDQTPSRTVLSVSAAEFSDVKAVSERTKLKNIARYVQKEEFFDREAIEEAATSLQNTGDREVFDTLRRKFVDLDGEPSDIALSVERAILKVYQNNREKLEPFVDLRANKTEQISSIARGLTVLELDLPTEISAVARQFDITPEEFFQYYRFSSHLAGVELAKKANLSFLPKRTGLGSAILKNIGSEESIVQALSRKEDGLSTELKILSKQFQDEDLRAQESGKIVRGGIDLWRALIISQPATTVRNVVGSALNVPGLSVRQKLDTMFVNFERSLLGLPKLKPEEINKNDIGDLTVRLLDTETSVYLMDLVADQNEGVRRAFNDNFGDRSLLNTDKEQSTLLKALQKIGRTVNVLNIAQDRAFKSAAFMNTMQSQINRKRNFDSWESDLITVEDIIVNNRLDLFDDDMIAKSIQASYDMTFQMRNAGDRLFGPKFLGHFVNSIQRFGMQNTGAKLFVPFANFMTNMFVFTTQRMGGFAIKGGTESLKLLAAKHRSPIEVAKLAKLKDNLSNIDPKNLKIIPPDLNKKYIQTNSKGEKTVRKKVLEKDINEIEVKLGNYARSLERLRDSIREGVDFAWMLGGAVALRATFGGDTYDEIKFEDGTSARMDALFPVPGAALMANLVLERINHKNAVKLDYPTEVLKVTTGVDTGRSGILKGISSLSEDVMQTLKSSQSGSAEYYESVGKSLGYVLGQFFGGFTTPVRVGEDLLRSTVYAGETPPLESALQKDVLIKAGIYNPDELTDGEWKSLISSTVDELTKAMVRGTPLERVIYSDVPEKGSITEAGTERRADVPFTKQVTGMFPLPRKTDLQAALDRENVESWKLRIYSEVPEYKNIVNVVMGKAAEAVSEEVLSSEEYINAPRYSKDPTIRTKSEILEGLYKGTIPLGDEAYRKLYKRLSPVDSVPTSLRSYATIFMKERFKGLYDLHAWKKSVSKATEVATAQWIRQNYPDEAENILTRIKNIDIKQLQDPSSAYSMQLEIDVEKLKEASNMIRKKGRSSESIFGIQSFE